MKKSDVKSDCEKKPKTHKTNNFIMAVLIVIFIGLLFVLVGLSIKVIMKDKTRVITTSTLNTKQEEIAEYLIVELQSEKSTQNPEVPTPKEEPTKQEPVKQEAKTEEASSNAITKPKTVDTSELNKYYIKINYKANVVTIYTYDNSGNYTIPVKALLCSTGVATPKSGTYGTLNKYTWALLNGGVWGQYSTRIVKGILFHSVPYRSQSKSSLISSYYDKLGTTASAGCIRLTTIDAKWIYENCTIGTKVEFYASSNPGPLGKPEAMKISSYPGYLKSWDPTDPDTNNPWISYFADNNKANNTNASNVKDETKDATVKENSSEQTNPEHSGDENQENENNENNENGTLLTNET